MKRWQKLFFILFLSGFMICAWQLAEEERAYATGTAGQASSTTPTPTPTPAPVKVISVDYEELWLDVSSGGHDTVYYSDKNKKVWTEAIGFQSSSANSDGSSYRIDISWISNTGNVVICLKGDKDENVRTLTLPARNSKLKAKYNKTTGEITFENIEGATEFEWRKATSFTWNEALIADAAKEDSAFRQEIEKMRISGASIYVRLPGSEGKDDAKGEFQPGVRPSKEVKLSITKRPNAPKITIDGSKLTVNTKTTMQYSVNNGATWNTATEKMPVLKFLQDKKDNTLSYMKEEVTVLFRTAKTERAPFSKELSLTIPKQREAPKISSAATEEVSWKMDAEKFYLTFRDASKEVPYEYTIVKSESPIDLAKASWKSVTSSKEISLSQKTAPAGSTLYIRKKMIKASKTAVFQLASDMSFMKVQYNTQ